MLKAAIVPFPVADDAEAGEMPNDRFGVLPKQFRLMQGLVVEADRQQTAKELNGAQGVPVEGWPSMLRYDLHTIADRDSAGPHARHAIDLHEAVRAVS